MIEHRSSLRRVDSCFPVLKSHVEQDLGIAGGYDCWCSPSRTLSYQCLSIRRVIAKICPLF
jgi:hypothetical protein